METLQVLKAWCRNEHVLVLSSVKVQKQQLSTVMVLLIPYHSPSPRGHVFFDNDFSRWQARVPPKSGMEEEGA